MVDPDGVAVNLLMTRDEIVARLAIVRRAMAAIEAMDTRERAILSQRARHGPERVNRAESLVRSNETARARLRRWEGLGRFLLADHDDDWSS